MTVYRSCPLIKQTMQYWFLLVFLLVAVEAAIVGVDIGSEYIRVGIAESNAPIRMVLNEQSSAKTLNAIVVKGSNETYVGERAKKFVSSCLILTKRYLVLGIHYLEI
jgi:molecular chaperone DnaK (HSP70)